MKVEFLAVYAKYRQIDSLSLAETEIVEILYKVAGEVGPRFRFGYLANEDVIQEGVLFGLEAIEDGDYDPSKPLENFMRHHIHNRLHNYKRNNFYRREAVCECCDMDNPPATPCEKFAKWFKRNNDKRSLTQASASEYEATSSVDSVEITSEFIETLSRIDEALPVELRADYLRLRDGVAVPKARRKVVREALKLLLLSPESEECP
jgi:hypothetical protein